MLCAAKTPKSTRFGWKNPISARWNSDKQLVLWREAWADTANRHLEQLGAEVRIDHQATLPVAFWNCPLSTRA